MSSFIMLVRGSSGHVCALGISLNPRFSTSIIPDFPSLQPHFNKRGKEWLFFLVNVDAFSVSGFIWVKPSYLEIFVWTTHITPIYFFKDIFNDILYSRGKKGTK